MNKPLLSLILGGRTLQAGMAYRARQPEPKAARKRSDQSIEVRGMRKRFEEERERANLSVVALEDAAEVGRGTVSRLESGKRIPSVDVLFRLARELRLSLHWLITGEGQRHADYSRPASAKEVS